MSGHGIDTTPGVPKAASLVAQARQELNLSREGLAFKAHVSVKTIERIERGETVPHRNTRESIARVLRRKSHELFPPIKEEAA